MAALGRRLWVELERLRRKCIFCQTSHDAIRTINAISYVGLFVDQVILCFSSGMLDEKKCDWPGGWAERHLDLMWCRSAQTPCLAGECR